MIYPGGPTPKEREWGVYLTWSDVYHAYVGAREAHENNGYYYDRYVTDIQFSSVYAIPQRETLWSIHHVEAYLRLRNRFLVDFQNGRRPYLFNAPQQSRS